MEHQREIRQACLHSLFFLQDEDLAWQREFNKLTSDQKFYQQKSDEMIGILQKAKQNHQQLVEQYEA